MSRVIIPQEPEWPGKNVGEQPAPPTGFDYQVQPQPEHVGHPLTPNSEPPIMPSAAMDVIYPGRMRKY